MKPRVKIEELKERLVPAVEQWACGQIDGWAKGDARLSTLSVYLKRGVGNYLARQQERLCEAVDGIALFLCDKDGNIDAGTLFDDLMTMFRSMEETPFSLGFLRGTLGGGTVRIEIPDNPLTGVLFGKTGAVKLTEEDFAPLRDTLTGGEGIK